MKNFKKQLEHQHDQTNFQDIQVSSVATETTLSSVLGAIKSVSLPHTVALTDL
jgi:hypothetical protein